MVEHEIKKERAVLAGVHTGCAQTQKDTTEATIKELARLADTADTVVVASMIQNKSEIEKATYLGEGKVEELKNACAELDADVVIFDDELSPMQIRNLESFLGVRVIDRSMLILDIFANHAQTAEGKIQVELAQLKYLLPRLTGMGSTMSRLGGGVGTRGPGETKLETDRRHIRNRITHLNRELEQVKRHRTLLRERRTKDGRYTVALVGYTNAGKSTLLNLLTDAQVLAEDKLFATLDPTIRAYILPDKREITLSDTVGLIRKLPHHLIEAFKSTLEEAAFADALLIVADAADPEVDSHLEVVFQLLDEIHANEKPKLIVFNKSDLTNQDQTLSAIAKDIPYIKISAKNNTGVDDFIEKLSTLVPGQRKSVTCLLPYSCGSLLAELHQFQTVISEEYTDCGTLVTAMVDATMYAKIREYVRGDNDA